MSGIPLAVEIISLFFIVFYLLHNYADFRRQNRIILLATFVAWYFSIMIVILLPMDISLTTYRQCLKDHEPSSDAQNMSNNESDTPPTPTTPCRAPWSHVGPGVFPVLWRIIYWSSQLLTWLILPFMQSFCQSGEFYLSGKLRGALISNAIYYGTYLAIFGVLLIYVAVKNDIDGQKLKVIGITASNTWGLFLLVLLLGYGLVALPRSLWEKSQTSLRLKQIYFKIAKLHGEKCEAEENLEDILNEIKTIAEKIKYNHPLRHCVDIIVKKCPETFRTNLRRNIEDYSDYNEDASQRDVPNSEKSLVALHSKLIRSLQVNNRTSDQWSRFINEAIVVEDVLLNETNSNHTFMTTSPVAHNEIYVKLFKNPKYEWFYQCIIRKFSLKFVSIVCALVTVMVIWSEMTFFSKRPVLSLFAIFLNRTRVTYNYLSIEVVSCLIIGYLCCCAYYAVFKLRIFNYYYVASNHQTSENSLIFSGTLLCRLTSPLCYNFLGLMHLDSHITKDTDIVETEFTSLMGHMDVISFISDGFNIYFPFLILILCLATFFNLGGRVLHFFGFEQFIGDPEVTQDLIEDGKNLVKREKRRLQRTDPEVQSRHREVSERLRNNYSNLSSRSFNNLSGSSIQTTPTTTAAINADETSETSAAFGSSMASSVKNIFGSKMPSFLNKKETLTANNRNTFRPNVREYRDIPSDQETDHSIIGNIKSDSRSSFEGRNQLLDDNYQSNNQPKWNNNSKPPARNIFDDV